ASASARQRADEVLNSKSPNAATSRFKSWARSDLYRHIFKCRRRLPHHGRALQRAAGLYPERLVADKQSSHADLQAIVGLSSPLSSTSIGRWDRSGHESAAGDGIVVHRPHRRTVERADTSDRINNKSDLVFPQLVENAQKHFAFKGKAGHRLAFNDRFPGLCINNARRDCQAVTHGPDDAAPIPDICCDGLEIFSRWIVIKCSVTGGRKEQSVILALQLRGLLESRVKLDIERMLWVAKNRFVASRQELQHQRHLVNSACAGLGGQVDLKAGLGQDFER